VLGPSPCGDCCFSVRRRCRPPRLNTAVTLSVSSLSASCRSPSPGGPPRTGGAPSRTESTLGRRCCCTGPAGEASWPGVRLARPAESSAGAMLWLAGYIREPRCSFGTLARPRILATRVRSALLARRRRQRRPLVPGASRPAGPFGLYGLGLFLGQDQPHSEELVAVSSRGASKW